MGRACHYSDVIKGTITSQITSLTTAYSTVYSETDEKNQKLRVTGLCAGNSPGRPVNSPHKCPVTRKIFPFDDYIMHVIVDVQYRQIQTNTHLICTY